MSATAPGSLISSPPSQDIVIVRGDVFQMVMGFLEQPDVVANPAAFRLRLAFRRRQSDTLPDLASFNAVLEIEPDETVGGVPVAIIATFDVDPITTQNLPANGCVYRVEWTDAIGQSPRRVLQGHVRAED